MKDSQGRTIDYLRISITDRCNLRCRYCMPQGIQLLPKEEILTLEEICRVARCAADLGIRFIKVTGGEPLVRRDCCSLVGTLKKIPGIERVTLTTNGVMLDSFLDSLEKAGIDGINISLDTADPECYERITGRNCLAQVLSAIDNAAGRGIPVKINAVALDLGEDNWKALLNLGKERPVDVRLIELMPVGMGKGLSSLDPGQILEKIAQFYPGVEPDDRFHGPGPAVYYRIPGFKGSLGLIGAIHGKFCSSCNRIRMTARGYLKTCLCYEDGVDLRPILRQEGNKTGGSGTASPDIDEQLRKAIGSAVLKKPAAHCFEHPQDMTERAVMSSIGG